MSEFSGKVNKLAELMDAKSSSFPSLSDLETNKLENYQKKIG